MFWKVLFYCLILFFGCGKCYYPTRHEKMVDVLSWKQIGFDFAGVLYRNNTDYERKADEIHFNEELDDFEKFFIQYNNVPIGFEVYNNRVFITTPKRRYGIPSTLNYVDLSKNTSPLLKPYPDVQSSRRIVSVYRPRIDNCERLWVVDTGLLEIPDARKQIQPPAIIVYDLKTNRELLRYQLKSSDLATERTPGGLTSITVDVDVNACEDAYAYINDLATNGLIVFSMRERDSWRLTDPSFVHEPSAVNFSVAGHTINWLDGLFSIALVNRYDGRRVALYHPLVSTHEYSIDTNMLKNKNNLHSTLLGSRGLLSQSGSHDFHVRTRTLFFANVAQDAILCWNVDTTLEPQNVAIAVQDHKKLVYISDLKVIGDYVWVLANQIPKFIYSRLNTNENNYFIRRGKVQDLIRGTVCDRQTNHWN